MPMTWSRRSSITCGADSKSAAKPLLADLTEVKADGKETVIFTLANAQRRFSVRRL